MRILHHLEPSSGRFFVPLDGLRGIAILLVVICHVFYANPESTSGKLLQGFANSGHLGVQIFFVLSGFLISKSIFSQSRPFIWRSYLLRRFAKIYPPLILITILAAILSFFWKQNSVGAYIKESILIFLTVPNFVQSPIYVNPVYWSLYCEIHFYLAIPVIFLLLRRFTISTDVWTTAIFFFVPILMRVFTWSNIGPEPPYPYTSRAFHALSVFPRTFDCFAYGMAFACLWSRRKQLEVLFTYARIFVVVGLILLLAALGIYAVLDAKLGMFQRAVPWKAETFRALVCMATFFLLFVIQLPENDILSRLLSFWPLVVVGIVSYEWFMLHMPPSALLRNIIGSASGSVIKYAACTIVPALGTFILAVFIYRYYSFPILSMLGDKAKEIEKFRNGVK